MRRDAREGVFKIIYSEIFNDGNDEGFVSEIYAEQKLGEADKQFADMLLKTVRENREAIDEDIGKFSQGYKVERLYPTDRAALVIAFAEMKYFGDIPMVVSIDEALAIVKKYSTAESLNFVNGILAAYKKFLENENGENN